MKLRNLGFFIFLYNLKLLLMSCLDIKFIREGGIKFSFILIFFIVL